MEGWIWGAIGAALLAVEVSAPGFFLIYAAGGSFITGAAGFFGVTTLEGHLLVFAVATSLLFAVSFRSYRRIMHRGKQPLVNNPDRLRGSRCTVEEPITNGRGKVRLGDTVWLARGPDLPKGSAVKVRSVDGTVLEVEP